MPIIRTKGEKREVFYMRKWIAWGRLLSLVCALLIMSCASAFAAAGTDWESSVIEVEGTGVAPSNARNAVQARMMARRAAVVDAYRQIAEQIAGVQVDAATTVEDMAVSSDVIKTNVSALVQGARIVDEKMVEGGQGYTVRMQVPLFGVTKSVAAAVLPQTAAKEPLPAPVASVAPSVPSSVHVDVTLGGTAAGTTVTQGATSAKGSSASAAPAGAQAIGGYTGLIVDCSGLGLKPAMSPVIKNDLGQPIYGYKNLDYDKVVTNGMAGYTSDLSRAARAGSNPLVVRAIRLDGGVNPVLSTADANRVLIENGATGFLDKTNVVFVR